MLEAIFQSGIDLILYMQSAWEASFATMRVLTFLGTEDFYSLILPVILWSIDYSLGLRIAIMLGFSGSVNQIFKMAFLQPRPYWYDARVQGLGGAETGFGVPSGHAQISLDIYGLIAATVKKNWATILAVFLIVPISISRMVLGVHFHLDIIVGWIIGGLILWAFLKYESRLIAWFAAKTLGEKISTSLGISITLILIGALIGLIYRDYSLPQIWVDNAMAVHPEEPLNPLSLSKVITPAATLFGIAAGAFWLETKGGFDARGALWKRAARFILGVIGVLIILQGLGSIFPRVEDLLSFSLRFIRYALVGIWVAAIAPTLFIKLKLAEPKS